MKLILFLIASLSITGCMNPPETQTIQQPEYIVTPLGGRAWIMHNEKNGCWTVYSARGNVLQCGSFIDDYLEYMHAETDSASDRFDDALEDIINSKTKESRAEDFIKKAIGR